MPINPGPSDDAEGSLLGHDHQFVSFNAQTGLYEDFIKAGIIDSTKMVCSALEIAASVAGLLITTEVAIATVAGGAAEPSRHYGYDD